MSQCKYRQGRLFLKLPVTKILGELPKEIVWPECGERGVCDQGFPVTMNDWPDNIGCNAAIFAPLLHKYSRRDQMAARSRTL